MNREILFKAKRIDNGEWVEGYYIEVKNQYYEDEVSCVNSSDFNKALGHYICDELNRLIEVIPETVCQYTGLNDKNGKKIFDKDRLKRMIYTDKIEYEYYIVKWVNDLGRWCFVLAGQEDYCIAQALYRVAKECEVIGSIHDKEVVK